MEQEKFWEYYKSLSDKERKNLLSELKKSNEGDTTVRLYLERILKITEELLYNPDVAKNETLIKSLFSEMSLSTEEIHYSQIKDYFKVVDNRFYLLEKLPEYVSISRISRELEVVARFEDLIIGSALLDLLEKKLKDNSPESFSSSDNNLSINDVYNKAILSMNKMYAVKIKHGIITDKTRINEVLNYLIEKKEEYFFKMISE